MMYLDKAIEFQTSILYSISSRAVLWSLFLDPTRPAIPDKKSDPPDHLSHMYYVSSKVTRAGASAGSGLGWL